MGGTTVSSDTLSANLHGYTLRRIGSETFVYLYHILLMIVNPLPPILITQAQCLEILLPLSYNKHCTTNNWKVKAVTWFTRYLEGNGFSVEIVNKIKEEFEQQN